MINPKRSTEQSPGAIPAEDPAIAAIARHRAARERYLDLCLTDDFGEQPETKAADEAEMDALDAALAAEPKTLAGAAALAAYSIEVGDMFGPHRTVDAMRPLAEALKRLVARQRRQVEILEAVTPGLQRVACKAKVLLGPSPLAG